MLPDAATEIVLRFESGQYDQVLGIMSDSAFLPATYAAWRRGHEERLAQLAGRDITAIVVTIDPAEFAAWCMAADLPCDAHARLEYADWVTNGPESPLPAHLIHLGHVVVARPLAPAGCASPYDPSEGMWEAVA